MSLLKLEEAHRMSHQRDVHQVLAMCRSTLGNPLTPLAALPTLVSERASMPRKPADLTHAQDAPKKSAAATPKQGSAFITTKKGSCFLTIKLYGQNFHICRIRNYAIEPYEKRHLRRLYPDIDFDWKKITLQLADKREVCRSYRARRSAPKGLRPARDQGPFYGVYDPRSRTVYVDEPPSGLNSLGCLLDSILHLDRIHQCHPERLPELRTGLPIADLSGNNVSPIRAAKRRALPSGDQRPADQQHEP